MGLARKFKDRATALKGMARNLAGRVTGNKRLKAKGTIEEKIGKLRHYGEKARDFVKR
jgi:uncharacterized protein YjbJ (UPF0337 family)